MLVYRRPDHPDWGFSAASPTTASTSSSPSGKAPTASYRIIYKDLKAETSEPVDLIDNFDNEYSFIGNDGPVFYFKTDLDAPRGRVIAIDIRKPDKANWKEIIPQAKENLESVSAWSATSSSQLSEGRA